MAYDIPETAEKYAESQIFTQDTVPAAFTSKHRTKTGTWGRLVVLEGMLIYTREGHEPVEVTPQDKATIFPAEPHFVTCPQPVTFKVEFMRVPVAA